MVKTMDTTVEITKQEIDFNVFIGDERYEVYYRSIGEMGDIEEWRVWRIDYACDNGSTKTLLESGEEYDKVLKACEESA